MMENYTHLPVMPEEVAQLLATDKDGLYVDATLGMGGHTLKLLSVLGEKARVIGVDWDPEMAAIAAQNTEPFAKQVRIIHGNFANLDEIMNRENVKTISGVLFDLGVSSLHFDKASRGFSLRNDGPLDMRINPANPLTAYAILRYWPYEQIEHLIRVCGERHAAKIARAIVSKRETRPLETTGELRELIERVLPWRAGGSLRSPGASGLGRA